MSSKIFSWIKKLKIKFNEQSPQTLTDKSLFRLITKCEGYYGVYDGKAHSACIETVDNCNLFYSEDNHSWTSVTPSLSVSGSKTIYVKAVRNKRVEQCIVKIEIAKRNIILISTNAEKEYDGAELVSPQVSILGDGFIGREGISAHAISSLSIVGRVKNEVEYTFFEGTNPNNYSISIEHGELVITEKKDKFEYTLYGKNHTCMYDGEEKSVVGLQEDSFEYMGRTYRVSGVHIEAFGTNVGTYQSKVKGNIKVIDTEGKDLTEQFIIRIIPGVLTITQREVYIESASKTAEYTGDVLSDSNVIITGDGFVEKDHVEISVWGKQTVPGSCVNYIKINYPKPSQAVNYKLHITEGKINVIDRAEKPVITVKTLDHCHPYTGNEIEYVEKINYSFADHGHTYRVTGGTLHLRGINAGFYPAKLKGTLKVYDEMSLDVTAQFILKIESSKLEITKRNLVIKSASAEKEYDGWPLFNTKIELLGDGLAECDSLSYATAAQITNVGYIKNEIQYSFIRGCSDNYEIELQEGILAVKDRVKPYLIEYQLQSKSSIYDGTLQKYEESIDLDLNVNEKYYHVTGIKGIAEGRNAGLYEMTLSGISTVIDEEGNDVSKQFFVSVRPGNLQIDQRIVTITSESVQAEYSGNILSSSNVKIAGDGFAERDNVHVSAVGEQLLPGTCYNRINIEFPKDFRPENYKLQLYEGNLTITERKEKPVITIEASDYTHIYTGYEQKYEDAIQYNFENNGHSYYITGSTIYVCGTNVGVYLGEIEGNLKVYDDYNNDVTNQFVVNLEPSKLEIKKRHIIIKSASAQKEYDGWPLSNAEFEILGDGIAECDELICKTTSQITLVGATYNHISYAFRNENCINNYDIALDKGELTVTDREVPYQIEFQLESQSSIYEGVLQKYEVSLDSDIEVNGKMYHVSGIKGVAEGKDAGHYPMNLSGSVLIVNDNGKDVSKQFTVSVVPGYLHINYRTILLESGSSTRQYDGISLENSEITISGDGFVGEEGIHAQTTSSITTVGRVKNEISFHLLDNTKPSNYAIKLLPGLLTVVSRTEKIGIVLHAKNKTSIYDGAEQSVIGLENHTFEYLGNRFSVSIDIAAKGKDAGIYWTSYNSNIIVHDSESRDVSDQFDIQITPGKLRINRREVIIESTSALTEYTGDILSASNVLIKGDGFVESDNITVSAVGQQTVPGSSINSIQIVFPANVNQSNYYIRKVEGELIVTDRHIKPVIVVNAENKEFLYNGNEFMYEESISLTYCDNNRLYNLVNGILHAKGTNAGEYPIELSESFEIFDLQGHNVTDQFIVSVSNASMIIKKRHITITPILASKEYDGIPLTSKNVLISGDGFIGNDGIEVYSDSSLRLPGRCENEIQYCYHSGTDPENYIITIGPGELIVFDREIKYQVHLIGETIETTFDGSEKKLPEFTNLDFELNGCNFHIRGVSNVTTATDEGVYQADSSQTVFVYDDFGNEVSKQFDIEIQYGSLTILHNSDLDESDTTSNPDEKIDEYDVAIQEILNEMSGNVSSGQEVKKYSRKILESLYVDHIRLLSRHGIVDPNYDFMLAEYPEVNEFSIFRNRIAQEFKDADLLCQIEISDSDYAKLQEYSRTRYLNNKRNEKRVLVDILFSVFLVQTGIRYYEHNYWSHVAKMLGVTEIDPSDRVWVGGTVTKTLLAFGKPVYSKNEYVTNILMHSFVTDAFAYRFFDYIFQYYSIDMERDLSGFKEIDISYLCNSIINPYAKRKQLLSKYTAMSIRGAYEYCKNVIINTLHMIDCSFWDEEYDEYVLTGRLARRFEDWKQQSDFYQTEKRKYDGAGDRNRLFRAPHLMCDFNTGSFSITLPPQIVHIVDEDERPDVRWFVVTKDRREFDCELIEGYSGYKTKEIVFRPEPQQIFEKHIFLLFVNRQMVRSFTWDTRMVNFFKPNGIWLKGERLEPGLTYAFGRDDSEINSDSVLYISRKNGLKFYELNIHKDDLICVTGENNYYVGNIPKVGVTSKGCLDDVYALPINGNSEEVRVYHEIPTVVIDVEQEQYHGVAVILNKKVHKLSTLPYTDVRMGRITERKYYFVDIQNLTGLQIGWNKVVIDYPKTAMYHTYEFYYYPSLCYTFLGAPYIFADSGTLQILRSSPCVCTEENWKNSKRDIEERSFSMDDIDDGYIYHQFNDDCILKILIPMLQYSWDDILWSHCKMDEVWHANLKSVIYLKYPENKVSLCVEGMNEYISMIGYRKQQSGKFVCDLTKLKSYFSSEKIIETINLIAGDIRIPLIKILQKSYLFDVKTSCDYEEDILRVIFDLVGENTYYADLYCDNELISEKVELQDKVAEFNCYIETANYSVKLYESEDEFGFDDDYTFVSEKTFSLINPLELIGGCMKVKSINYGDRIFEAREDYAYYLFLDKQISTSRYNGIISGVFHNEHVMYASNVIITIPDLNDISKAQIIQVTHKGKHEPFILDLENRSIIDDFAMKKRTKDKDHCILSKDSIWNVDFISANSKRKKESIIWIEEHEKARGKKYKLWKTE